MPDDKDSKNSNWWTTLPGILTSLATLIATIAGVYFTAGQHNEVIKPGPSATSNSGANTTTSAINLSGTWDRESKDCLIIISQDDGKTIRGNCDNASITHIISGTYQSANTVSLLLERRDQSGCIINTTGVLRIIGPNELEFGQSGWHGCGVSTESIKQIWIRK